MSTAFLKKFNLLWCNLLNTLLFSCLLVFEQGGSSYTISFPNGDSASLARRKCIMPNGMPTRVMQKTMPKAMWVRHIQMPPTKNHNMFMNRFRHPVCELVSWIFEPNGQSASSPIFMLCQPKGMPIMVSIINIPAIKYSTAISRPPKMTQIMFPIVFMFYVILLIEGIIKS